MSSKETPRIAQSQNPTQQAPQRRGGPMGMGGPMGGMMGAPAVKAKNFGASMKRLLGYLKPMKLQFIVVFAAAVGSTIFSIVSPKILGHATTKLFEGLMGKAKHVPGAKVDFAAIGQILLFVLVLYVVSSLFAWAMQFLMAGVSQRIAAEMRSDVNRKLALLPLRYYDGRTHGEILSRVTNDVDNIGGTLQQSMTQIITSACTLIGVVVMMLTISPLLTLITVVTIPVSILITMRIAKSSQKNFAAQQKELGALNGHVEEMVTGHPVVKVFGREKDSLKKFGEINGRLYNAGWRAQFVSGVIMPLMGFVNNIGYVLVCVAGGILVTKRAIAIGDIQAFIQYARQFSMPIAQVASIANVLQSTVASAERVFEVLDEAEESADAPGAAVSSLTRGEVNFENVRFGYSEDKILFDGLNLSVLPGETVAIVGPTGAGKTTLVNLLMRFYEVSGGRITVDGRDIKDLPRGQHRRRFGMVLQDTWLFNGTIRENIAYGRPGATDADVTAAAKAAFADHFVRALPEGYDTQLTEDASNLSQGEKQLLTIARAVIADPAVLILDEATSSVDTRTELHIRKAMETLRRGRTSFVIAHRLSTIRDAKTILVMRDGRIVEKGGHDELIAAGGFYQSLYESQFAAPAVD